MRHFCRLSHVRTQEIALPKYKVAWYINEHKQWEEASYRELARDERRAELRECDLRDERDGVVELGIRNHPTTPHFFERRRIRTDLEPGAKESEAHEEQKRMIRAFLSKYEKHASVTTSDLGTKQIRASRAS